jgi:hypothetical protein
VEFRPVWAKLFREAKPERSCAEGGAERRFRFRVAVDRPKGSAGQTAGLTLPEREGGSANTKECLTACNSVNALHSQYCYMSIFLIFENWHFLNIIQ